MKEYARSRSILFGKKICFEKGMLDIDDRIAKLRYH